MSDSKLSCLFCSIIVGTIPAKKIIDTEDIIVIKDIAPKAPIHYLLIPKIHLPNLLSFDKKYAPILGILFETAHHISQQLPESRAFRLVMNNGAQAGQSVFHWHVHFLAGKMMADF